ncbi:MAG: hypothetical protein C6I00_02635 [Nitratiruptor sp.]|nr:hypothetical protein [Nitratiruptor sp.]NPA82846.1 hypothetical protein [Campylobacterota bacterium]
MKQELYDIKPLVPIPDYSFLFYTILILFTTLIVALAIYWIVAILARRKITQRQEILAYLRSLDRRESKRVAYEITRLGRHLVTNESTLKIYEELLRRLARYKYRAKVPPLDEETNRYIDLFLKMGDDG